MTKVFVTMGIPGSGKSYATQVLFNQVEGALIINPDSIRAELTGDASDQSANAEVFKVAHSRLVRGLVNPQTSVVVFDATNVQERARAEILAICAEHGADTALLIFDVDFGVCAQRNYERKRTVPMHAMVRMQTSFEESLRQVGSEPWGSVAVVVSADADGVVTQTIG